MRFFLFVRRRDSGCFNRYSIGIPIYYSEYEITTFISLALFLPNTLDPGSERRTDLFSTYSIVDIDGRASQNYRGYSTGTWYQAYLWAQVFRRFDRTELKYTLVPGSWYFARALYAIKIYVRHIVFDPNGVDRVQEPK